MQKQPLCQSRNSVARSSAPSENTSPGATLSGGMPSSPGASKRTAPSATTIKAAKQSPALAAGEPEIRRRRPVGGIRTYDSPREPSRGCRRPVCGLDASRSMRIAVITDIHSNLPALEAVLEEIDRDPPDELWCLGDIVGYGAQPE